MGRWKKNHLILVSILTLLFSACQTSNKSMLKGDQEGQSGKTGILLGEIVRVKAGMQSHATLSVTIDGTRYPAAVERGILRVTLPAGRHRLETVFISPLKSHSLNIDFKIRPGKATNLGMIVLLLGNKGKSSTATYRVDNSSDMARYLKVVKRDLKTTVSGSVRLAKGKYLDTKGIERLRRKIAAVYFDRENIDPLHTGRWKDGYFVYGPVGTLFIIQSAAGGAAQNLKYQSIGTVRPVTSCSTSFNRLACIINDINRKRIYVTTGFTNNVVDVPRGTDFDYVFLYGGRNIIVVDKYFIVHASDDNGESWHRYSRRKLDKPLSGKNAVGFSKGENGVYVFARHEPGVVLYRDYDSSHFMAVNIPRMPGQTWNLVETPKGLVIGPSETLLNHSKIYLQNGRRTAKWVSRTIPASECKALEVRDEGKLFSTRCKEGQFVSQDRGKTWRPQ